MWVRGAGAAWRREALELELELLDIAFAGEEVEDVGGGADDGDAGGHDGEVRPQLLVRRLLARAPRDRAEEHLDSLLFSESGRRLGVRALEAARRLNPSDLMRMVLRDGATSRRVLLRAGPWRTANSPSLVGLQPSWVDDGQFCSP